MKKVVAVVVLVAMVIAVSPLAAQAHGGAALALGAFAAFSILTWPLWALAYPVTAYPPAYPTPVYSTTSAPYYAAPAYTPAPATPAVQREVVYPHGRHVLYGDGVTTAYQWVWVPNPPPPPPPALAPSPQGVAPPAATR